MARALRLYRCAVGLGSVASSDGGEHMNCSEDFGYGRGYDFDCQVESRTAHIYFGIDPGKSGSIAAVWSDGEPASSHCKLNGTEQDIADFLRGFDLDNARAVIERVSSSPQMGVVSAFTFGRSYGFLRGLLAGFQVPYIEVQPQKWQKGMQCMTKGDKNVSKSKAQQLWPKIKITHANADALLLAEYGRRFWV